MSELCVRHASLLSASLCDGYDYYDLQAVRISRYKKYLTNSKLSESHQSYKSKFRQWIFLFAINLTIPKKPY